MTKRTIVIVISFTMRHMRVRPPARDTMVIIASMWYFHPVIFDCWSYTGC